MTVLMDYAHNPAGLRSLTVVHMEVPCCTGLKWAVDKALELSGKNIPVRELEIKIGGEIVELK